MFENIVIGIDGREGGRSALALARRLAGDDAELTLANVYGTRIVPGRGAGITLVWESEASEALLESERQKAGLPDATILRSSEPSVGRGLHEIAEYVKADLLVIGATHRGRAARAVLGDDTASVLHEAPCPVAIAPIDVEQSDRAALIGVGFDGSPESSHALAAARTLAERMGARLQVLSIVPAHIRPPWEPAPPGSPDGAPSEPPAAESVPAADDLARRAELRGMSLRVIQGDPAEQLTIWTHALDLLVIGTRSPGVMGRLLTGSVARHLALHAACPLLIWPRSAHQDEQHAGAAETTNVHS